jgi:hypothetical protein
MSMIGNEQDNERMLIDRFYMIDPMAHRNIVEYYESNREQIAYLADDKRLNIFSAYLDALYQLGHYSKYLKESRFMLESLYDCQYEFFDFRSILTETLYCRSRSLYELGYLSSAEGELIELLKLDRDNKQANRLIRVIFIQKKIELLQGISAVTIITSFSAAAIIGIELLYIRSFHSEWTTYFEWTRNILLSFSIVHFFVARLVLHIWSLADLRSKLKGGS